MSAWRLDRYLSLSGERTRSQAVCAVRMGQVCVNGEPAKDPARKVTQDDRVTLQGREVPLSAWQYYMFHKPAGVLTAARDRRAPTVMDLVPPALLHRRVLPVGRLDKDVTGLLLLTNDGALAHALLDPNRGVWKRYRAQVSGRLTQEDAQAFARGIALEDFTARPAELGIVEANDAQSVALVRVCEGRFHQVKRMFQACGHEVLALHRAAFGPLELDETLPPGGFRPLTPQELEALRQAAANDRAKGEG